MYQFKSLLWCLEHNKDTIGVSSHNDYYPSQGVSGTSQGPRQNCSSKSIGSSSHGMKTRNSKNRGLEDGQSEHLW